MLGSPAVIIENGSYRLKACIAEDHSSKCCFASVIGRKESHNQYGILIVEKSYVGDRPNKYQILKYPIQYGIVNDWDDMERIWHHAFFNELRVTPEDHPALLTEAQMSPKNNREKMSQILFEKFNVPQFYLTIQAMLSLYASGRTTGIVVDSGDDVSHTVPIYEGYALQHGTLKFYLTGRKCTQYLVKILNELDVSFTSSAEMDIVRDMKEKLCYVALDYEEEMKKYEESAQNNRPYELPDGKGIIIQNQRFRCPELLFKPYFIDLDVPGIHELTFNSIMKCDIELRKDLYQNIILSGGNTLFPGLPERLGKELSLLRPKNYQIQIIQPCKDLSPLIGGSIFAQLLSSSSRWITRAEYDEAGPYIVHRRCF